MRLVQGGCGEGSAVSSSPSSACPQRQPRIIPEAHLPFLDTLAELLAFQVVSQITQITAGSGPRTSRNNSFAFRVRQRAIRRLVEVGSNGW